MRIWNGTEVTWTSQANAYAKQKTGRVLAFVPAWADPRVALGRSLFAYERADGTDHVGAGPLFGGGAAWWQERSGRHLHAAGVDHRA